MDFSQALLEMKAGKCCQRAGWNNKNIWVAVQFPDENSKNTLPYLMMIKTFAETENTSAYTSRFPLDLSCESIFAEDWEVVEIGGIAA